MANTQSKDNGDKWRKVAFVVAHREKVRRVAAETAAANGASSSKAPFKACVACRKYNKSFLDNLMLYTADVYADFVTFNDDQIAQLLNKMSATVPKLPFCKDCWTKWRASTECCYVETSPTSSPTTTGKKRKSSSIHPSEPVEKKPARKLTRRQKKQSVEFTETAGVITKTEPISEEDEEVATIMTGQSEEVEEGEIVDERCYEKVPQENIGIGQPTEHDC